VTRVHEFLIQECMTQAMPSVGEQERHRSSTQHGQEPVDPFLAGKIGLDRLDHLALPAQLLRRVANRRVIGCHEKVAAVICALLGEFQPNAAGRPGDDSQRSGRGHEGAPGIDDRKG